MAAPTADRKATDCPFFFTSTCRLGTGTATACGQTMWRVAQRNAYTMQPASVRDPPPAASCTCQRAWQRLAALQRRQELTMAVAAL